MTPKRKKRLYSVVVLVLGIAVAVALILNAFDENLLFFYSPSEVVSGKAPSGHAIRVGGLVVEGSVQRNANSLTVQFDLTDTVETVPVQYTGILPDLFREGQGIISRGRLDETGIFIADEVLAKHDETYMPPEVADALETAHKMGVVEAQSGGAMR